MSLFKHQLNEVHILTCQVSTLCSGKLISESYGLPVHFQCGTASDLCAAGEKYSGPSQQPWLIIPPTVSAEINVIFGSQKE